jgi:hypothetical protein
MRAHRARDRAFRLRDRSRARDARWNIFCRTRGARTTGDAAMRRGIAPGCSARRAGEMPDAPRA